MMYLVVAILLVGVLDNIYNTDFLGLNPPLPQQIVSMSFTWPPSSNGIQNVLDFNGSMYLNIYLLSNGSIIQGQRVIALATGGMTTDMAAMFSTVFVTFPGSSPCYLPNCEGQNIEVGGPPGVLLSINQETPGYPPISDIGNQQLPVPVGGNHYPIDWQSSGTYYATVSFGYSNNDSVTKPYTVQEYPISVAPAIDAIWQRSGRIEFFGVVATIVGLVEFESRRIDREK
jgi:hypothetical protein